MTAHTLTGGVLCCHTAVAVMFAPMLCEVGLHAQVNEEKEARKVAAARLALAGGSFAADEDPFEGLSPRVCTSSRPAFREARGRAHWQDASSCLHKVLMLGSGPSQAVGGVSALKQHFLLRKET